jgi:hypothetical protein
MNIPSTYNDFDSMDHVPIKNNGDHLFNSNTSNTFQYQSSSNHLVSTDQKLEMEVRSQEVGPSIYHSNSN